MPNKIKNLFPKSAILARLITCLSFVFAWLPELGAETKIDHTLRLATVTIGELPSPKTSAVAPTRSIKKRKGRQKKYGAKGSKWHLVTGYRGQEYVYGEIQFIGNNEINGFVYRADNELVYIYGIVTKHSFNAFDLEGNLYQMLLRSKPFADQYY